MKSNPKISIITITYNSEKTLEETIKSVISQKYDNLEYLIIDGKSTDGTLDIVEKYRDKIDVIISETDKGISDAFNKGIRLATGEIIGIINSDDILLPGALEIVASYYSSDIDVYSGNVMMWNYQTDQCYIRKPDLEFKSFNKRFKACHPSRFITRGAYKRYGYYSLEFRYCMDVDLLIRFLRNGARFMHIDKSLTKFRIGATSSDPVFKKKKDYYNLIINNGGSKLDFYMFWYKSVLTYLIKVGVMSIAGRKTIDKLRSKLNIQ